MNGVVVFRKAPAADVLAAITRWYGYQIQLTDSTLATRNLTVALSTQSSADALSSLKLVLGVDIAFEGNRLILTPRRSPRLSGREREVRPASQPQREVGR
jgi:ferric-dicitrate binding protein FerR (iron transport regulator)